jgi:hypothetical protein
MRFFAIAIPILIISRLGISQEPALPQERPASPDDIPVFGTTVVLPSGLKGEIYNLKANTSKLPNFAHMKPVGAIYTNSLNIPVRDFTAGFPGVTNRSEWFAIDYTGRFWIETPGVYNFELVSDDGSKLFIDDREVIDNDGAHVVQTRDGEVALEGGIHNIRVSYFQGRRYRLALILKVKAASEESWKIFSTEDYRPPAHPEDWRFGAEKDLDGKTKIKK